MRDQTAVIARAVDIQESLKILQFRYGRKVGFRPGRRTPRREVLSRRREAVVRVRDRELDRGRQNLTGLPGPQPPLFNILSHRINH